LLLAGLGALASLAGGASAIAKTVIDKRARDRELDEQQRHNMAMESSGAGLRCDACKGTGFVGSGVFLNPNTEGSGLYLSPAANQCTPFFRATTNFGIMRVVEHLGIENFRGVFMRDKLPLHPIIPECGIVNLDDEGDNPPGNAGTHWVAYLSMELEKYILTAMV